MVELEIVQGIRPHERRKVRELLLALEFYDTTRADFVEAGERLGRMRRQGITVPASDALVAQVCVRHGLALFTLDRHFNPMTDVRKHAIRM